MAVNGDFVGTIVGKNVTNSKNTFHMITGKSETVNFVEQFQGAVTNIKLFKASTETNLTEVSSESCRKEGDVLAWTAGDWRVEGY